MIQKVLIGVMALSVVSTHASLAREGFYVELSGGGSFPVAQESFAEAWKTGYNLGGGIGYALNSTFSLTASALYNRFEFDEQGAIEFMDAAGAVGDGTANILTVSGSVQISYRSDRTVSPYAIVGAGVSQLQLDTFGFYDSQGNWIGSIGGTDEFVFSFSLGLGADMRAGERVVVFLQGQCVVTTPEQGSIIYLPITLGLRVHA